MLTGVEKKKKKSDLLQFQQGGRWYVGDVGRIRAQLTHRSIHNGSSLLLPPSIRKGECMLIAKQNQIQLYIHCIGREKIASLN